MLLKVFLTSALATFALANPSPQTSAQTTEVVNEIASYQSELKTEPAIESLKSMLRTDIAGQRSFLSASRSIFAAADAGLTVGTDAFNALPTYIQPVISSVQSELNAIGTANGFLSGASLPTRLPTSTPTAVVITNTQSKAAAPTGMTVGFGAVLAGGFGVVVAAL